MACIDRTTWNAAVTACNAQSSVKGLGIWASKRRPRSMQGLGILGEASTLDVSPVPTSDPCAIAAQTPCPSTTPAPPPLRSFCSNYPTAPSCQPKVKDIVPTPPPPAHSSETAGYMKIGLLAALVVVGGVVVYKSMHKKAS